MMDTTVLAFLIGSSVSYVPIYRTLKHLAHKSQNSDSIIRDPLRIQRTRFLNHLRVEAAHRAGSLLKEIDRAGGIPAFASDRRDLRSDMIARVNETRKVVAMLYTEADAAEFANLASEIADPDFDAPGAIADFSARLANKIKKRSESRSKALVASPNALYRLSDAILPLRQKLLRRLSAAVPVRGLVPLR